MGSFLADVLAGIGYRGKNEEIDGMWETAWITFVAAATPLILMLILSRWLERKPKVCFVRGAKFPLSETLKTGTGEEVFAIYTTTFLIVANRGSKPATSVCVNLPGEPFRWKAGGHNDLNKNSDGTATIKLGTMAPNAQSTITFAARKIPLVNPPETKDGYADSVTYNEGTATEVDAIPLQEHPPERWLLGAAAAGALVALLVARLFVGW